MRGRVIRIHRVYTEYQRAIARKGEMQGEGWNNIGCLKWQLGCLDKRGGSRDFMSDSDRASNHVRRDKKCLWTWK